MRQMFWGGLGSGPKGFWSFHIPDLALGFWARPLV